MNESPIEQSLRAARNHVAWPSERKAAVRHLVATHIAHPMPSRRVFWWRFVLAPVAALSVAVFGTAAAAERALPGDVLYRVKVAVNEPMMQALAPTPEKKAALAVAFAERRLDEADTLSESGRMQEPEAVALGIEDQSRSAATAIRALTKGGKSEAAEALRKQLTYELERRIVSRKAAALRALPEAGVAPSEAETPTEATSMALPAVIPAPAGAAVSSSPKREDGKIDTEDAESVRKSSGVLERNGKPADDSERVFRREKTSRPERLERAIRQALRDLDHED